MSETTNNQYCPLIEEINAPSLTETGYANKLSDVFSAINDNFTKLANHDFIKGETGDSVEIKTYDLSDSSNSDFKNGIKNCITKYFGKDNVEEKVNGIGAFDIFNNNPGYIQMVCSKEVDDNLATVYTPVSSLYYVFIDNRFANENVGKINPAEFNNITDVSCIITYGPLDNEDNEAGYGFKVLNNAFPTIYYESGVGLCWKINGNNTNIPVQGIPGKDGLNSKLFIVKGEVENNEDFTDASTTFTVKITSLFNGNQGFSTDLSELKELDPEKQYSALILTDTNNANMAPGQGGNQGGGWNDLLGGTTAIEETEATTTEISTGINGSYFYFGTIKIVKNENDTIEVIGYSDTNNTINTLIKTEDLVNFFKRINLTSKTETNLKGLFIPIDTPKQLVDKQRVHLLSATSITNNEGSNDSNIDIVWTPINDINNLEIVKNEEDSKDISVDKYVYFKVNESEIDKLLNESWNPNRTNYYKSFENDIFTGSNIINNLVNRFKNVLKTRNYILKYKLVNSITEDYIKDDDRNVIFKFPSYETNYYKPSSGTKYDDDDANISENKVHWLLNNDLIQLFDRYGDIYKDDKNAKLTWPKQYFVGFNQEVKEYYKGYIDAREQLTIEGETSKSKVDIALLPEGSSIYVPLSSESQYLAAGRTIFQRPSQNTHDPHDIYKYIPESFVKTLKAKAPIYRWKLDLGYNAFDNNELKEYADENKAFTTHIKLLKISDTYIIKKEEEKYYIEFSNNGIIQDSTLTDTTTTKSIEITINENNIEDATIGEATINGTKYQFSINTNNENELVATITFEGLLEQNTVSFNNNNYEIKEDGTQTDSSKKYITIGNKNYDIIDNKNSTDSTVINLDVKDILIYFNTIFTTTMTPAETSEIMWFNGFSKDIRKDYVEGYTDNDIIWNDIKITEEDRINKTDNYKKYLDPVGLNITKNYDKLEGKRKVILTFGGGNESDVANYNACCIYGWQYDNKQLLSFLQFTPIFKNDFKIEEDTTLNINYNVNITGDNNNLTKNLAVNGVITSNEINTNELEAINIKNIYTNDDIVIDSSTSKLIIKSAENAGTQISNNKILSSEITATNSLNVINDNNDANLLLQGKNSANIELWPTGDNTNGTPIVLTATEHKEGENIDDNTKLNTNLKNLEITHDGIKSTTYDYMGIDTATVGSDSDNNNLRTYINNTISINDKGFNFNKKILSDKNTKGTNSTNLIQLKVTTPPEGRYYYNNYYDSSTGADKEARYEYLFNYEYRYLAHQTDSVIAKSVIPIYNCYKTEESATENTYLGGLNYNSESNQWEIIENYDFNNKGILLNINKIYTFLLGNRSYYHHGPHLSDTSRVKIYYRFHINKIANNSNNSSNIFDSHYNYISNNNALDGNFEANYKYLTEKYFTPDQFTGGTNAAYDGRNEWGNTTARYNHYGFRFRQYHFKINNIHINGELYNNLLQDIVTILNRKNITNTIEANNTAVRYEIVLEIVSSIYTYFYGSGHSNMTNYFITRPYAIKKFNGGSDFIFDINDSYIKGESQNFREVVWGNCGGTDGHWDEEEFNVKTDYWEHSNTSSDFNYIPKLVLFNNGFYIDNNINNVSDSSTAKRIVSGIGTTDNGNISLITKSSDTKANGVGVDGIAAVPILDVIKATNWVKTQQEQNSLIDYGL